MLNVKKTFALLVLGCITHFSWAQDLNTSPYTRFGLGEIINPMSTPYSGVGSSIALSNFRHINFSNPATYGTLLKYNPVFDAGFMGRTSFLKTSADQSTNTTVGLRNFALLMPVTKKTGFMFGLMPFSTTGYDINTFDENTGDTITYNYSGAGSVNRLIFGLGQQVINKGDSVRLSLGANASYLFGTLQKDRVVAFQEANTFNTHLINKSIVRGFAFDFGLHYFEKVKEGLNYQLGATAKLGAQVNGIQDTFYYTFKYASNDNVTEVPKDTTVSIIDSPGSFNIPRGIGFGAAVQLDDRITWSAQYEFQNWNNYSETFDSITTTVNELAQSWKMSYGLEYVPYVGIGSKNISAFKIATYRLGVNYGKAPYNVNNTHLKQYGMSFGISMPLISSYSTSTLNLGFELGRLGTTESSLIQDTYFNFNVGLSLSPNRKADRWFWKRLYD